MDATHSFTTHYPGRIVVRVLDLAGNQNAEVLIDQRPGRGTRDVTVRRTDAVRVEIEPETVDRGNAEG